jgi:hypothetical protein
MADLPLRKVSRVRLTRPPRHYSRLAEIETNMLGSDHCMRPPENSGARRWYAADLHLLAAGTLVVLFTLQRLTGYMTLFVYQRLPYDDLVYFAHFFGGTGLVAACTMGTAQTPMKTRTLPLVRVIANAGWLVGSLLVLFLWWICNPAWRPHNALAQSEVIAAALLAIIAVFRPINRFVSRLPQSRTWKIVTPVFLWVTYSLDWELRLNFLKDEVTRHRPGVQWLQIAVDLLATATGLAWTLWVQRRWPPAPDSQTVTRT